MCLYFVFPSSFVKEARAQRGNEPSFPFYPSRPGETLGHYRTGAFSLGHDVTKAQDRGD